MPDQLPILLAEDDQKDVVLVKAALGRIGVQNPIMVAENGQEVIDYLAGQGKFSERERFPLPALVLLDLKMPWMDGFDVLAWLRGRPQFEKLPVVVLTSSQLPTLANTTRSLGAYDFRVKPNDFDELMAILDEVCKRWLGNGSDPVSSPPSVGSARTASSPD